MSPSAPADEPEGDEPWTGDKGEDLPDEVDDGPGAGSDQGLDEDDLPATHMDEDEYAAYAAREFDARGRERGAPPVAAILIGLTLLIVLLALLLA